MNYKHIIALAAFLALPVSAQDAPPPAPADAPAPCCHAEKGHKGHRGHHGPKGMGIIAHQLVLEKYDIDTDGKLNDAEKEAVQAAGKKAMEAKRAEMIKKLDKDGDGKVSKEERQAARDAWAKENPELAAKMEAKRAEKLKKFDKDGDGKISKDERGERKCKDACKDGEKKCEGKKGHGKKHHGAHGPGPGMMIVGFELVLEKYDIDKDGKLSDSEKDAMKADAMEARKARKAARDLENIDKQPAAPAPAPVA